MNSRWIRYACVGWVCTWPCALICSGQTDKEPALIDPIITDEYAIFPVTTELQRGLLEDDAIDVCVFVNGSAFRKVEKIDRFLPAFEKLQKQLADQPKDNESGVVLRCIDSSAEGEPSDALGKRLERLSTVSEEIGYYAGYLNVKWTRTYTGNFDWQKFIDKARKATEGVASSKEEPTGNRRDFKDGRYTVNFDRSAAGHFVRVEADGYRSAISRKIKSDEGAVELSFELEPLGLKAIQLEKK